MKCEFEYCDNEVVAVHTDARGANKRFCSKKCSSAHRCFSLKTKFITYCGGKCQCCGYNKYVGALEFHHVDKDDKEIVISRAECIALSIIMEELKKCVLVCSNCHREIHRGITSCPTVNQLDRDTLSYLFDKKIALKPTASVTSKRINSGACSSPGCQKTTYKGKPLCNSCIAKQHTKEVGNWPTDDELKIMAWKMPTTDIGKLVGVSDKAVEKRMKRRGIEKPPRGHWSRLAKEIMSKQSS